MQIQYLTDAVNDGWNLVSKSLAFSLHIEEATTSISLKTAVCLSWQECQFGGSGLSSQEWQFGGSGFLQSVL